MHTFGLSRSREGSGNAFTRTPIYSHSRLNRLCEMPDIPIANTKASTERIEMPSMCAAFGRNPADPAAWAARSYPCLQPC
jgi:hypothetical protein